MVFPMLVSSLADRHTSPVLWCTLVSGIQGPEDCSLCSWDPKLASVTVCNTSLLLALFPLSHEAWVKKQTPSIMSVDENVTVIPIALCADQKLIMEGKIQEHPGRSLNKSPLRTKSSSVQFFIVLPGSTCHPNSKCPATPFSHVQNKSQLSGDHRPVEVITTWYHLTWLLLSQLLATRNFNVTVLAEELILRYLPDELSDRKRIHDEEMLELSK